MNRRVFLMLPMLRLFFGEPKAEAIDVAKIDGARIFKAANAYLDEEPVTVTSAYSARSAGGPHDYFSEGDYWWPDPSNPKGPYIQRDGLTNPDNFTKHRQALMRLSLQVPALAAAWSISKDNRFALHAVKHLRAWFLDPSTIMNPNLQFSQAITGRSTGRGIGIIDTIHLVEVVFAARALEKSGVFSVADQKGVREWFAQYLKWMTTHAQGIDERDAKNNHGTCWVMQVAAFASYINNIELLDYCRERYKTVLLPTQLATDGSFPLELKRTKPYSYSLFNLEAMVAICQILPTQNDNLWTFKTSDGRGIEKALQFMFPYIANKRTWPFPADVMYFGEWPVRHSSLLFGGIAFSRRAYIDLWRTLNPDPVVEEVIRNYPIRQPVLWESQQ